MRNEKFTPGEWRVVGNGGKLYICYDDQIHDCFPPDFCVCGCGRADFLCGDGTNIANAALIAAAPDMYECLCDALTDLQMPEGMRRHFEAVLKKARGEE